MEQVFPTRGCKRVVSFPPAAGVSSCAKSPTTGILKHEKMLSVHLGLTTFSQLPPPHRDLLEFTHVLPASNLLLPTYTSEPTPSRSDALTFRLSASWPLLCFPVPTSLADEDSLAPSPGPKETVLPSFHVDPKSFHQLLPSSSLLVIWESGMGQGHREVKDRVRFC